MTARRFASAEGCCGTCRDFSHDPLALEHALPALAALSSAHAASRTGDGLCRRHDRLLRASASCSSFAPNDRAGLTGTLAPGAARSSFVAVHLARKRA